MGEILIYQVLPEPCQGPYKALPGGWQAHDCDNCLLFPCKHWRALERVHRVTVHGR
jgi:hypothetical protein